ncbi:MAG: ABC transporter ATP-binding protein, partial [candidate division Zixibacteria bacterium]|nr:ABC transporter ATP-binding protein [candidate division Zixibacteria bacterium]
MPVDIDTFESESSTPDVTVSNGQAFRALLPYVREHAWGLGGCLILLAIATGLSLYWPVLLRQALDVNIVEKDVRGLVWTVGQIALIQVMTLALQYVQRIRLEIIGQTVMVELKQKIFGHLLTQDVVFFDRNPVGRLLARVESDTESLRVLFTNTAVLIVGDILLIAGIFGLMLHYSWQLALVLSCFVPVVLVCVYIFQKLTAPKFLGVRKKMAEVTATLTEMLHGMAIVQIFHRAEYARERLNRASRVKAADELYGHIGSGLFFNAMNFVQYAAVATVLFCGALWKEAGVITIGTISMFVVLIWRSFDPIYRTSEQMSVVLRGFAGARRIVALLSEKPRTTDPESPVALGPIRESIRFEHVWFSYSDDDHWVLSDVSFEIPVGRKVALVGVTGGGKSTVISLLLRLYDPQKGRITIDGVDIRNFSRSDLRRKFALVLQDIILFPGTVADNVSLENEGLSRERVVEACRTVAADGFIERLPKTYETEVSEKGSNFSRGERQLLSFARALAVDPEVLLLDEATSSVDPQTERTLQ